MFLDSYVKINKCRLLPTAPNSANTSALLCVRDGCHFSRAWRNTKNCIHIYRQYINSHTEIKRIPDYAQVDKSRKTSAKEPLLSSESSAADDIPDYAVVNKDKKKNDS